MCGFTGIVSIGKGLEKNTPQILEKMMQEIAHRGPDSQGKYVDEQVALGHLRLSIHDLTQAGHQPMNSHSGRYIVVFNGEIYNFKELRSQLGAQVEWKGHSDTEVMLASFDRWGIEKTLSKLNGMFAFAVWDIHARELTLARDRFGEKPLYYCKQNEYFVFASEIKSLEECDYLQLSIDRFALGEMLKNSYIPAPLSVYEDVYKLEPGHFLTLKSDNTIKKGCYWSLSQVIEDSLNDQFIDEKHALDSLDLALKDAVSLRMASDVPLGAFLSGGIDSSTVVALMQSVSDKPVNTFSIGFDVKGYNEAEYAKEVANYLGTNHHEEYLSSNQVLDIVPEIANYFDEPFSDSSQIPTYLVSKIAKTKVTVSLSGDGGDELFGGYKRYFAAPSMWSTLSKIPAKNAVSKIIKALPVEVLNVLGFPLRSLTSKYGREGKVGPKLKTLSHWLGASDLESFYRLSMQNWSQSPLLNNGECKSIWNPACGMGLKSIEKMMYQDSIAYLPGDILTKVDRAAMAVSLEGRIPLLDHNLAAVAWKFPLEWKLRDNGKWPLKQVLYRYLPKEMMDRPKVGFGVPLHEWLRTDLKDWSGDLLNSDLIKRDGLFDNSVISKKLSEHQYGQENNASALWSVLMIQAWLDAKPSRRMSLN